jgi:mono/diheme cytochrome c family protein
MVVVMVVTMDRMMVRAQEAQTPPVVQTPVVLDGATLFGEKGCAHCHGAEGGGTEKGPSLRTVGKRRDKEQIAQQIHDGGKGMPAFGDVLEPDEAETLMRFLAAKKSAKKPWSGAHKTAAPRGFVAATAVQR